jgi:hypothetical protein
LGLLIATIITKISPSSSEPKIQISIVLAAEIGIGFHQFLSQPTPVMDAKSCKVKSLQIKTRSIVRIFFHRQNGTMNKTEHGPKLQQNRCRVAPNALKLIDDYWEWFTCLLKWR